MLQEELPVLKTPIFGPPTPVSQSFSSSSSLFSNQKLKDVESIVKIEELKGAELVKDYSDEIERMLGSKMKSVKVRRRRRRKRGEKITRWRPSAVDRAIRKEK